MEYEIKEQEELIKYLRSFGLDPFNDFSYQLKTNYGYVFELENKKIVFMPSTKNAHGLIFKSKKDFADIVRSEIFPIPNINAFQVEMGKETFREIYKYIEYYKSYLNQRFDLTYVEISRESAEKYTKKLVGKIIRKKDYIKDYLALTAIYGDLIKKETNGKWLLYKYYGTYNPFYHINILMNNNGVIDISDLVFGITKWKITDINKILRPQRFIGHSYDKKCELGRCTLIEE